MAEKGSRNLDPRAPDPGRQQEIAGLDVGEEDERKARGQQAEDDDQLKAQGQQEAGLDGAEDVEQRAREEATGQRPQETRQAGEGDE